VPIETDLDVRTAYSADASGLSHIPDGVARPESIAEIADLMRHASVNKVPVTPAGMQTSTTGASVAERGTLLSLRRMDRIIDIDVPSRTARVQAGAIVGDVKRAVAATGLLFAPDPTSEDESSIGGAVACNASGARTLKYGATRKHVRALTVVLASGETVEFRRRNLEKDTAGYAFVHDPVDWFVGSEGTLGVVVEAELALLPLPARVIGLQLPFATEQDALAFVVAVRDAASVEPRCLEYFDELACEIAHASDPSSVPSALGAMVYTEQELPQDGSDTTFDAMLDAWLALAEAHDVAVDDVRMFDGEQALATARRFRHAVPSTMNERGAVCRPAGGRKVSTDWAVPYHRLYEVITASRDIARRRNVQQAVTYGHAGNGHPHQNYIAHDAAELAAIEHVVQETLHIVLRLGGTVSAEHGIGKIKRKWLPLQLAPIQLGVMRAVKRELDPLGILAPGNIF
jgi:FAD/FMN-containing dehydrogenase